MRVVKAARTDHKRQVTVHQNSERLLKSKVEVALESTNFYATNFGLGTIPPLFISQLGRRRWRIDAEVFQTITTDCHLKHPAVHQSTALAVPTMIRVLASTLSLVFYQRQVCSHIRGRGINFHEFAKRLSYGFATLSANSRCRGSSVTYRADLPVSVWPPPLPRPCPQPKSRQEAACQPQSFSNSLRCQFALNQHPPRGTNLGLRNRWRPLASS